MTPKNIEKHNTDEFGSGGSDIKFFEILKDKNIWKTNTQKYFVDLSYTNHNHSYGTAASI